MSETEDHTSSKKDHVSIHITEKLEKLPDSSYKPSIFRVSDEIRCVNEKLYKYRPKVLAVGPFYHSNNRLQKMEQHKFRYLKILLRRRNEQPSVDEYVMAIRSLEEEARKCYAEPIHSSSDDFVQMLLLDGIFIIELIRKYLFYEFREDDDAIFQHEQVFSQLCHDLMLVENQVPFFVLEKLFSMTKSESLDDNIPYLIQAFAFHISPWPDAHKNTREVSMENIDHLLGLVYTIWCSSFAETSRPDKAEENRMWCSSFAKMMACIFGVNKTEEEKILAINSITELQEAGIKFSKNTQSHFLDIEFTKGAMKIPRFNVSDATESVLKNLIAYEHFFDHKRTKYVTDYAFFWDFLINSPQDVEILRQRGIVTNLLDDDKMVSRMFNGLCRNTLMSSHFCYRDVFNKVNVHCGHRRNRWMANLRHNYFNSPWAFISFFAALMLLLFTLTQTVFSVLPYTKSKQCIVFC
ncbi:hypothetical protein BUALT_Bualt08G0112300 [Buddleja alternifolia]|uniref:Uncharacterized protein n=1 Tax=Buddleja alternifolia TaxID=168488 RepID=A0AAV6XC15_9LAMI|nr:hypothetical protein BUALT_Bualt08G0112300 [Buddleja alternifolia]